MHQRQRKMHICGNELPLCIPLARGNGFHHYLGQLSKNWINSATYQGSWWSSSEKETTSWGLYYICWLDFWVGALHLCMTMPIRQGGKHPFVLLHSSCGHGTEMAGHREKRVPGTLPCSSGIPQIKCGIALGKKIAEYLAVGVVGVTHTPHKPGLGLFCARE